MSRRMYFTQREAIRRCGRALATSFNISGRGEEAQAAVYWMRLLLDDDTTYRVSRWKRAEAAYEAARQRREAIR